MHYSELEKHVSGEDESARKQRHERTTRKMAEYEIATARLLLEAIKKRLAKIEAGSAGEIRTELGEIERALDDAKQPIRTAAALMRSVPSRDVS